MKTLRLISAVLILIATVPRSALACGGVGFRTPEELVTRAQVIVRARAEALLPNEGGFQGVNSRVQFKIVARLKGSLPGDAVSFAGLFENSDDWNDRKVPYNFIRPGGRHGNCIALTYRQGAEYLLLLQDNPTGDDRGAVSPYWASLAPTNEQIRGDNDQWLRWVTEQIARPSPGSTDLILFAADWGEQGKIRRPFP